MIDLEVEDRAAVGLSPEMIRAQLDLLVRDESFRSSRRSVAFLRYVVEQTLNGSANQIKERTIGVEVFGREPTYDTNLDHIVRTAATELRKRLAIYYGDEKHRSELRMGLIPGSYIPRFALPEHTAIAVEGSAVVPPVAVHTNSRIEPLDAAREAPVTAASALTLSRRRVPAFWLGLCCVALFVVAGLGLGWFHRATAQ